MRALRFHGRRDVRLDEIPEPEPAGDQVKIAVTAAGICGSDLHEYRGGPISIPTTDPHPLTGEVAPLTLGHEFEGKVVAVGPRVREIAVGDRVAVNAAIWCGECPPCRAGHTNICTKIGFHGVSGEGGAFADFDITRERNVHRLPEAIPDGIGALLEPLATGIHAVAQGRVSAGDMVLVQGGGVIGLCIALAAREAGAEQVVLTEPSAARRAAAKRFGATITMNPLAGSVVEFIGDITDGLGVQAAFDAAAAPSTLDTAVACTGAAGTVVNVAAWEKPVPFDPTTLLYRETAVVGSLAYTSADFDTAVRIGAARGADLASMVTTTITLDEAAGTFARLGEDIGDDIKVLVRPNRYP
ncbi:2,3-butanediol dehydrogenase [Amycolatopsis acidicola]|uniref:2,3-butanediol dehydrogenase n=1 Tax=Amycolatopsis acidicola TaxID=2596893 RepID=A0A5N0UPV5_9PSEU|nr:2,3-butanediol dehydrogenase [Amycolatopsis acidicola]KAA9151845.1 2,3-butanediol dehydrogenase [Amycolatopsis acidicola]